MEAHRSADVRPTRATRWTAAAAVPARSTLYGWEMDLHRAEIAMESLPCESRRSTRRDHPVGELAWLLAAGTTEELLGGCVVGVDFVQRCRRADGDRRQCCRGVAAMIAASEPFRARAQLGRSRRTWRLQASPSSIVAGAVLIHTEPPGDASSAVGSTWSRRSTDSHIPLTPRERDCSDGWCAGSVTGDRGGARGA